MSHDLQQLCSICYPNTDGADTEPLWYCDTGSVPESLGSQYFHCQAHNIILCAFLFKGTLFIGIELWLPPLVTHVWTQLIQHVSFLPESHPSLPALQNTRGHFDTLMGGILNRKFTPPPEKSGSMALSRQQQGPCFQHESWTKKVACWLAWPQVGPCAAGDSKCLPQLYQGPQDLQE